MNWLFNVYARFPLNRATVFFEVIVIAQKGVSAL
jgi:hypothetical protein